MHNFINNNINKNFNVKIMLMKSRGDGVIEDNNSSIYSNSNEVANVGSGNGGLGVTVLSILSRDLGDFYSIDI